MAKRQFLVPGPKDGISRRDFLNGALMAGGALLIGGCGDDDPMPPMASQGACDGISGATPDPRALRGGNLPSAFNMGHLLRDQRLSFSSSKVLVAPSTCDGLSGTFAIEADPDSYDVIIVGAGMSGLAAAYFLKKAQPGVRVLLLDANSAFGGNAGRDGDAPLPAITATGGAYAVTPYNDLLTDIYSGIGLDWNAARVPDPVYCYYFDDKTPYITPGSKGWVNDVYRTGLDKMPYPAEILASIRAARLDIEAWSQRAGSPTDPADDSDPQYDDLAGITLHDYFVTRKGFHPAVSDFYTRYSIDALAGTTQQVNAYSGISFLQGEYASFFALPGGNEGIARHLVRFLIPGALNGSTTAELTASPVNAAQLDSASSTVRLRLSAMAVHVEQSDKEAQVVFLKDGRFTRASAKAVILAGQAHTARHLLARLAPTAQLAALNQFQQVPVVVANVALKSAKVLVDLGLGYDEYWWGSRYWADFTVSDWVTTKRADPNRPTVLTFYGGNSEPPEKMAVERTKLMTTPFADYEGSLRDDLTRIFAGTGFDFSRDVSAVYVYRWGHGMLYPVPGLPFGAPQMVNGKAVRTPSFREAARQPIGRIAIGGQDTESSPAIESAIASGRRTASEALKHL